MPKRARKRRTFKRNHQSKTHQQDPNEIHEFVESSQDESIKINNNDEQVNNDNDDNGQEKVENVLVNGIDHDHSATDEETENLQKPKKRTRRSNILLDSHDSIAKTKPQRQSKPNSKYESPDIILLAIKGRIRKKIKCEPIDQESDDNANANKPLSKQIIIKQEPKDYSEISNNNQYDSEIHHNFVMNQYSKRTIRQPKYLDDTVPDGRNVRGRSIRGRGIRGRRSRGSIGGRGRGGHTVRDVRDESHSSLEINISPVRSTARKSVASVYKGKSTRARGWPSTRGTRGGRGSRGSRGTRGIRGIRGIRGTRGGRGSRGSRTANSVRIKQEIDSLDEYLNEGNAINGKNCNCKAKHMRYFEMYKENLEATSREEIKNLERELALIREKNYQLVNQNAQLTRENEHLRKKQNGVNQLDYVEVKIRELKDEHEKEMSSIKKQQWCYNCEKQAIYFCCWNTSYCSLECQQQHWNTEHRRFCRRKQKQ